MQAIIRTFGKHELLLREATPGRWGMTLKQIGTALGYEDPARQAARLLERHRDEVKDFVTVVSSTTVTGDRDKTFVLDQGILILTMLAKTEQAKTFRRWVSTLLVEIQSGDKQVVPTEAIARLSVQVEQLQAALADRQLLLGDPKTVLQRTIAKNILSFSPELQKLIVKSGLGLQPEPNAVWTASELKSELAKRGQDVAATTIGKKAKAAGIQCEKAEQQNAYGFWAITNVQAGRIVPQFQYNQRGRQAVLDLFSEALAS